MNIFWVASLPAGTMTRLRRSHENYDENYDKDYDKNYDEKRQLLHDREFVDEVRGHPPPVCAR